MPVREGSESSHPSHARRVSSRDQIVHGRLSVVSGMDSTRRTLPSVAMIAVPTLPSSRSVGTAISFPDIDQRPPPSVQGNGTAVSPLPSVLEIYMPVNVCEASINRAKRSRPSNSSAVIVLVAVLGATSSGVFVGLLGAASIGVFMGICVGVDGLQPVSKMTIITMDNTFMANSSYFL